MYSNTHLNICGKFLLILGACMAAPLAISLACQQPDSGAFLLSATITAASGAVLTVLFRPGRGELRLRDGYILAGLIWLCAGIFGAFPFYFSGAVSSPLDALFESVSGFTTTGATVFAGVEDKPMGVLFWRSLSHWLGGMGIIVLSVAFLPRLGAGAMQLFRAEVPGPSAERLLPRIKETARVLWLLYAVLTALMVLCLLGAGMGWFDAVNHAFATVATGGFSTRDGSIGAFDNAWIEIIVIVFTAAAGLICPLLLFRTGAGISSGKTGNCALPGYSGRRGLILALNLFFSGAYSSWRESLRHGYFQVVTVITTTGFSTADFAQWPSFARGLLIVLQFLGASAGSTSGAIKLIRIVIVLKLIAREFYRLLHPKMVRPIRIGAKLIPEEMLHGITAFIQLYFLIFAAAGLLVSVTGVDMVSAFSGAAATLGNVGPGLGQLGPLGNYLGLPAAAKVVYILCMLLGRLEVFSFALFLAWPVLAAVRKIKERR